MADEKLVVLKFQGDVERGFQIALEITLESELKAEVPGELPSPADLMQCYQRWQTTYRDLGQTLRILKPKRAVLNSIKQRKQNCRDSAQALEQALNQWLKAEKFLPIREAWLKQVFSLKSDCLRFG